MTKGCGFTWDTLGTRCSVYGKHEHLCDHHANPQFDIVGIMGTESHVCLCGQGFPVELMRK